MICDMVRQELAREVKAVEEQNTHTQAEILHLHEGITALSVKLEGQASAWPTEGLPSPYKTVNGHSAGIHIAAPPPRVDVPCGTSHLCRPPSRIHSTSPAPRHNLVRESEQEGSQSALSAATAHAAGTGGAAAYAVRDQRVESSSVSQTRPRIVNLGTHRTTVETVARPRSASSYRSTRPVSARSQRPDDGSRSFQSYRFQRSD